MAEQTQVMEGELRTPDEKKQVFICYAREDMAMAKKLYKDLKRVGVKPWLDTEDLQPGQKWKQEIYRVMHDSSYVLVLLSQYSLTKRGFIQKELKKALDILGEFPSSVTFLVPVRLEECEPKEEELQQLHWCDLFNDYHKGVNQILKVLFPDGKRMSLRSEPLTVSPDDGRKIFKITDHGLPREYIWNDYEDWGDVVVDHATGLIWQKSGSDKNMSYAEAQKYIEKLNNEKFAGHNDWRLPTIPELMSLLEPVKQSYGLYINPIFDNKQRLLHWSADTDSRDSAWFVGFNDGVVYWPSVGYVTSYVRAVRS